MYLIWGVDLWVNLGVIAALWKENLIDYIRSIHDHTICLVSTPYDTDLEDVTGWFRSSASWSYRHDRIECSISTPLTGCLYGKVFLFLPLIDTDPIDYWSLASSRTEQLRIVVLFKLVACGVYPGYWYGIMEWTCIFRSSSRCFNFDLDLQCSAGKEKSCWLGGVKFDLLAITVTQQRPFRAFPVFLQINRKKDEFI